MELDIESIRLASGAHHAGNEMCVMEAVAYVAGEPWSDHPECASPVIGRLLQSSNDALDDDTRQSLKPYISRLVGSRGSEDQETQRSWMAFDWLVRVHTPAWLDAAGLTEHADALRHLPTIDSPEVAAQSSPAIRAARNAAGDAAWAAARDAAGAATRDAAWDAAWAAAGDATRDATRDAAWDAAWAAARDAAGDAAEAAAWAAARNAAGAAARDALRPTVVQLQASAHDLVDRMIKVTEASHAR